MSDYDFNIATRINDFRVLTVHNLDRTEVRKGYLNILFFQSRVYGRGWLFEVKISYYCLWYNW